MRPVCSHCGREPLDTAPPALRAAGLVCGLACTAQQIKRGPWRAVPAQEPAR